MSLAIDVDNVRAVLLSDGWHQVDRWSDGRSSFLMDAYEFMEPRANGDFYMLLGGGMEKLIPATGFCFDENGSRICGPITSILAVKLKAVEQAGLQLPETDRQPGLLPGHSRG